MRAVPALPRPPRNRQHSKRLWQIGQSDDNTAEFAHAPKDYQAYREPGFYVVGVSDAKRDWPYVQPGPADATWTKGTPQTFDIVFGLKAAPTADCRLVLDFVDTHSTIPPKLRVQVNAESWLYQTPKGAGDGSIGGEPAKGREHRIEIAVPADVLRAGNNWVGITTVGGSWVLWDALWFEAPADTTLTVLKSHTLVGPIDAKPALVRHDGQVVQPVKIRLRHLGTPGKADVRLGDWTGAIDLKQGNQAIELTVPPVEESRAEVLEISRNGHVLATAKVERHPVRHWEIHIVHQTHLDIGFTHKQEDVLKLQVSHLKKALQLIDRTRDYPSEAQFKWHPEGMWAVEEFLRTASDAEKTAFIDACRQGRIHIDALYAQAMTGMYTGEELMELVGAAKRFEKEYGVPVVSVMQSDVPGYTWGLASVLAHNGIRYLSVGPNWVASGGPNDYFLPGKIRGRTHRGGRVFAWADQPFWWVDPSGKHRTLFWMPGWGYSGFHLSRGAIRAEKVFAYLEHLQSVDYPYDMVYWRYAIGIDNGPPSPDVCDVVKAWNEKYAAPRLILTNNSTAMKQLAERYGDRLPVVRGDFSPYWEDGCASTARATGVNRRACERITQAQILWSMLAPQKNLRERFDAAWHKMIMYDEHTWGAHCSISRPDDPFSIQQDEYKQAYAFDGSRLTDQLLGDVTAGVHREGSSTVDIYNTASWKRSDLVVLSKGQSSAGDLVEDDQGKAVPSQRLASGELAFVARDVPALGARRFTIRDGKTRLAGSAKAEGLTLGNAVMSLAVDPQYGAIRSLKRRGISAELVDSEKAAGLNDYLYILGRDANKNRSGISGPVTVVVEDAGPVVATMRIESDAPGCSRLTRRVRVVDGLDHLELVNTVDKLREQRPEGVYFGFPLNVPNPVARIDIPWAVMEVEKDQIRGANRNFYCVQRWVDLSNDDYGVTWATLDAPMLQFEPIKIALTFGTHYWREHIEPTSTFYSWAMNNHWECNYKAYQKGPIAFRYVLRPHAGGYDAVEAQRFGRGICQPLTAVSADPAKPVFQPRLEVQGDGVMVTSICPSRDGKAFMVRLFNVAEGPRKVELSWNSPVGQTWISNPMEESLKKAPQTMELGQFEILTLKVEQEK